MKVAIAGYGQEGQASLLYWLNLAAEVTVFDQKQPATRPKNAQLVVDEKVFSKIDEYGPFDLVVRTPSLQPDTLQTSSKIWSATNEFFAECPAPIVGVTGTKGKGTTCTLTAEILKAAGKTVHLVGNIGTPALEVLPKIHTEDIVVFELSSFQLWDLEKSPQTAVVLMIEPDHMDVHATMEEYVAAKSNITKYQSENDVVVYHPKNELSAKVAEQSKGEKVPYQTEAGAHIDAENIVINDQTICTVSEVGLLGAHNLENVCAAITAAWQYTQDIASIGQAVKNFKGLPHRLELVRELNGVKYYDDSFSANPAATIAAIQSFNEPLVLIAGGYDRGADFTELAQVIAQHSKIKFIELVGQTRLQIAQALQKAGRTDFEVVASVNFKSIVESAYKAAQPGDVVLLSPGCPSFDMFENFKDRGEQFKKLVQELQ